MSRYPDIDLFLTRNLTNNDIFVRSEEDSVSQNIRNLLYTFKGEKLFSPNYGYGLYAKNFDNLGANERSLIITQIGNTLTLYENRIIINDINIIGNTNIEIEYTLINTVTPSTLVI